MKLTDKIKNIDCGPELGRNIARAGFVVTALATAYAVAGNESREAVNFCAGGTICSAAMYAVFSAARCCENLLDKYSFSRR